MLEVTFLSSDSVMLRIFSLVTLLCMAGGLNTGQTFALAKEAPPNSPLKKETRENAREVFKTIEDRSSDSSEVSPPKKPIRSSDTEHKGNGNGQVCQTCVPTFTGPATQ